MLAVLAVACGGKSSSSQEGSDGANGTGTEAASADDDGASDGVPEECECVAGHGGGCLGEIDCGGDELCPPITWTCPNPTGYYPCAGQYEWDMEALACALDAMHEGKPGVIRAQGENDICGLEGCGTDYLKFQILPDRRVVREACSASPLGGGNSTPRAWELADPSHFETCIGWKTGGSKWHCLQDGILNSGAALCE
jgi:hypothetical protein